MLALRMFFWDEGSNTASTNQSNAGGAGSKRKKKDRPQWRTDEYFWALRWRYIRRLQQEFSPEPLQLDQIPPSEDLVEPVEVPETSYNYPQYVNPDIIPAYFQDRDTVMLLAKTATSIEQLRALAPKVAALKRAYAAKKAALEPAVVPEPVVAPVKRPRRILTAKQKKKAKLVALSAAILTLLPHK